MAAVTSGDGLHAVSPLGRVYLCCRRSLAVMSCKWRVGIRGLEQCREWFNVLVSIINYIKRAEMFWNTYYRLSVFLLKLHPHVMKPCC